MGKWRYQDYRSQGQTAIDVAFAPGEGKTIDHAIATLISSAQSRIKIASMVLTSHAIRGNYPSKKRQIRAIALICRLDILEFY